MRLSQDTLTDLHSIVKILVDTDVWFPVHSFTHAPWVWVMDQDCIEIFSDASGTWGLGAHMGDLVLSRQYTSDEVDLPIYVKELPAVQAAL